MHNKGFDQRAGSPTPGLRTKERLTASLQDLAILIVEDDALVALDLSDFLEGIGASVVGPAPTLEKALEIAQTPQISCAILDIHLAGKTVFPVAELLQSRGIPFVFHTGHGEEKVLKQDWPGCEVLLKPAGYEQLVSLLLKMAFKNEFRLY